MIQTGLNFSALPAERREGIELAEQKANKQISEWSELAAIFLKNYARAHEEVFAEDVTKAAEAWGMIAPTNARAWGGVYIRAQHDGIIEKTGETRRRENGSLAMVYRSLVRGKKV